MKTYRFSYEEFSGIESNDGYTYATFKHMYRTTYTGEPRRHACLINGYWCWRNALWYPTDVVTYLKLKRKRRIT